MRRHAKASTAGSTQRQAGGLGRIFRGPLAPRGVSLTFNESGAPSKRHLICALSAIALFLALVPAPASAVMTRFPLGFSPITGSGTGVTLHRPSGIAVDETSGNVFLNDGGAGNVTDIFGAEGGVPSGVASPYQITGFAFNNEPSGVAVDNSAISPSKGALYVVDVQNSQVKKFVRNGGTELYEAAGGLTATSPAFGEPLGAAVDSKGNVFVADYGSSSVIKFSPTGTQLARIDTVSTVGSPSSVALDNAGDLFVQGYSGGSVYKYPANGSGEIEPGVFTQIIASGGTGVAVDPGTNTLFVARGNRVTQYNAATLAPQLEFGSGVLSNSTRITVNSATGRIYVADQGNNNVAVFGAEIKVPGVSVDSATGVSPTKATLNGSVNPDSLAVSECKFEYGTDTSYGSSKSCEGAIPTDGSDHPLSGALTGLTPNTTYHFRIVATNANGTNKSADQSFTTANPVNTNAASGVLGTKATLNGAVFPEGEAVSECKFEYGTTTAYGSSKPCEGAIPTDENEHLVTAALTHLAPNGTTYHFRIVAVGGSGAVQGTDETFTTADTVITSPATAITGTAATFNGTLNPEEIPYSECKFEYGTDTSYGSIAPCAESPGAIGTGTSPVAVHADISSLSLGAVYHFRLIGANADGIANGDDQSFKTLSPPVIKAEWVEGVVLTEATLKAQINPEGFATTYHLEYGTDTSYGQSTAEASVGSDKAAHTVSNFLVGLAPGTTYHWRVVATNTIGTADGLDRTFTTHAAPGSNANCSNQQFRSGPSAALPNCRAFEMVSPVEKAAGDVVSPIGAGDLRYLLSLDQSSTSGKKFTYGSYRAFGDSVSSPYTSQFMASRGADGWTNHSISPPRGLGIPTNAFISSEFKAFLPDLSAAWIWNSAENPLTTDAPKGFLNLYKRDNVGESYEVLTNVQPNTDRYVFEFQGSSSDGSHGIFRANDALTPEAPSLGENHFNLYEWFGGELQLVSILPNGEPSLQTSSAGTENSLSILGASQSVDHAISDDGSRIFWSASPNTFNSGKIYVRIDGETTVPVSESVSAAQARFWTASADGSKAIFTIEEGFEVSGLYEFDVDTETPTLIAHEVSGLLGASDDASYIYFASQENLDAGATTGEPNVYLYHEGAFSFIGTLAANEDEFREYGPASPVQGGPVKHLARVTPDGRHAAFVSARSLTGYDNTDVSTGKPAAEVYIYDADSDQLTCASCNPSGGRPLAKTFYMKLGGGSEYFAAAVIHGWKSQLYDGRNLSDDGSRLFFESFDPLVPQDTNGAVDVYQWEAQGTGSCQKAGGCVSLISTGKSASNSEFVDASPSGDDVFIRTLSSIDPRDPGLLDIYDARVGGGFPYTPPPQPCIGDSCQSAPEPPNDPTPASASFRGAGNPMPRNTRRSCATRKRHAKGKRQPKSNKQTKRCKRTNRRAGR